MSQLPICFRLEKKLTQQLDHFVELQGYASRSEAIREAIFQLLSDNGLIVNPDLISIDKSEMMNQHYNEAGDK